MCEQIAPTLYKNALLKARKPHKCCECYKVIPPGEQYERAVGVWDGEFVTYCTCGECDRKWNEVLAKDSDIDKCHGELSEILQFMAD